MIRAIWDEAFKRSYRKRVKKNEDLRRRFWRRMEVFLTSPFSPQLRTHKLSGKLEGQWAFSIDDDCRVVFEFIGKTGCFSSTLEATMRYISYAPPAPARRPRPDDSQRGCGSPYPAAH